MNSRATAKKSLLGSKEEVERRLTIRSREAGQRLAESSSHISAMRGTWFTLVPHLDGARFNPPQQEVAWLENLQEVPFRLFIGPESDGKSLVGGVDVLADGLCVAVVPLALQVGGSSWIDGDGPWDTSSGAMLEEVFASYSRRDLRIVDACAEAYLALGIHLFVDRRDLLGGQEWHPALLQKIEEANAFQLFWSTSSRTSRFVEDEWRHAMSIRNQKGHRFLRPLYWEEPKPDAPADLSRLNFRFLDLDAFASLGPPDEEKRPSFEGPAQESPQTQQLDERDELSSELLIIRSSGVQASVLPLLAGESRQSLRDLRCDVARAVAFLEDLTGLRYYPVPTLLVDEFTVRRAREARSMVDDVPEHRNDRAVDELEVWTDILRALLLQFHVRAIPPLAEDPEINEEVTVRSSIPGPALEGLRQFADWGVHRWLWSYRHFPWEEKGSDQATVDSSHTLSEHVISAVDAFLSALPAAKTRAEQHTLRFSRPTSSDPSQFDDRIAWEAVSQELGVLGLAATKKATTFVLQVENDDSWSYEVAASTSVLITVLQHIRNALAAQLPAFDGLDYSASDAPGTSGLFCIGLAVTGTKIAEKLKRELPERDQFWGGWIADWVIEVIHPSWRRVRDWMAAAEPRRRVPTGPDWTGGQPLPGMDGANDFASFLERYFSVMQLIFREGLAASPNFQWTQRYGISEEAWVAIQNQDTDLDLTGTPRESWGVGTFTYYVGGTLSHFVELFRRAAERLLLALPGVTPRTKRPRVLMRQASEVIESSVFGVFVPAGAAKVDSQLLSWATQNGVMQQAVLPATPRVLYCTRPSHAPVDDAIQAKVGLALRQCVLIHEHFHAILETGVTAHDQTPGGWSAANALSKATSLNESLAAWAEWHFVRRHGRLLGDPGDVQQLTISVWAYLVCGDYPAWPYRGAERIEAIYVQRGIGAVRTLIHRLRQDPVNAQREFDALPVNSATE